jgi:hypothetical protein
MFACFRRSGGAAFLPALLLLLPIAASPAAAQITIASEDGRRSLKLGVLGQVQAETLETPGGESADNLFIRRLRLIAGFTLSEKLSVFLDTDTPNFGKANPDGTRNNADVFIHDFVATYAFRPEAQVDAGLIFVPLSYNHLQGATNLMALDYGPFTLVEAGPTGSRAGRDYGVQARGYLAGDRFEYRAGVFQGVRGEGATNDFRTAGRVAWHLFGPQTAYFYRGTSLGQARGLTVGAGFDRQEEYEAFGGDLFWEQPVRGGDGITVQADVMKWDGDTFLPTLPEQTTTLVEAGYYFHRTRLQPWLQYAEQDFADDRRPDEERAQAGLGWFFNGHNASLKLGWTRVDVDGAGARDEVQLQFQVFAF